MAIVQTAELERFLQMAFDKGASDLLLIANEPPCFRVNGVIQREDTPPLSSSDIRKIAMAALGEDQIRQIGSDVGRLITSCSLPGVVDGRMCIARSRGDYSIVVRLLPTILPDAHNLGVPQAMQEAALSHHGLVICAGPAGSGKTTVLFSLIDHINNNQAGHICTVEDPITYYLEPKKCLVQQREVGVDVPDVVSGIAAAMQQDLDVLLIGEIKSVEALQACITAAQTGHLVMTQIHARSPESAIQRLVDVQPEADVAVFRRYLAEVIRGVSAQVLVPKADGKGRVGAFGVLVPDDEMRQAIAEGREIFDRKKPLPPGCRTLPEDIERLREEGVITRETAEKARQFDTNWHWPGPPRS